MTREAILLSNGTLVMPSGDRVVPGDGVPTDWADELFVGYKARLDIVRVDGVLDARIEESTLIEGQGIS